MKGKVRVFVVPAGPDLVKAVLVERLVVVRLCENPLSVLLALLRPKERVDGGVEAGQEDAAADLELARHLARQTFKSIPILPEMWEYAVLNNPRG